MPLDGWKELTVKILKIQKKNSEVLAIIPFYSALTYLLSNKLLKCQKVPFIDYLNLKAN